MEREHTGNAQALRSLEAERVASVPLKSPGDGAPGNHTPHERNERAMYDPRKDSTPDSDDLRPIEGPDAPEDNPGFEGVILQVQDGESRLCGCGCGEKLVNQKGKSQFRQGHDARLKGILQRAHVHGEEITILSGGAAISGPALGFAKERGWERFLTGAAERAAVQAAKPKRERKAKAQKDVKLINIKVGRWTYKAVQVGDEFAFTDGKGNQKLVPVAKATVLGEVGA